MFLLPNLPIQPLNSGYVYPTTPLTLLCKTKLAKSTHLLPQILTSSRFPYGSKWHHLPSGFTSQKYQSPGHLPLPGPLCPIHQDLMILPPKSLTNASASHISPPPLSPQLTVLHLCFILLYTPYDFFVHLLLRYLHLTRLQAPQR